MSLGVRNSKRSRSQSPGLLFRGDRQGVVAPVRQDGGGAETRRAARNERKQKTAVLQGAARLQAVKRSRARETRRQKDGDRRSCRNIEFPRWGFWLGRERAPVKTPVYGAATRSRGLGTRRREVEESWDEISHLRGLQRSAGKTGAKSGIDAYARGCSSVGGKINEFA
jgi:hypothetical protein